MKKVYPFASGSEYTSSYAVTASYASSVASVPYVNTASIADTVLNPRSGSAADVNICKLYYEDYLKLFTDPNAKEICIF